MGGVIAGIVVLLVVAGVALIGTQPYASIVDDTRTAESGEYAWIGTELCEPIDVSAYTAMDPGIGTLDPDAAESTKTTNCAAVGDHGSLVLHMEWLDDERQAGTTFDSTRATWMDATITKVREHLDDAWESSSIGEDALVDETSCGAVLVVKDGTVVVTVRFSIVETDNADQAATIEALTATARQALEMAAA
ncbi:hypothetical protein [Stackebrandtia soli]|uniref:hypothetical protein n=1 Tax=Stackebrandtia soli TaxID=1892856 RepID=UPI0039E9871B